MPHAEQAAEGGADHEADAECGPYQAKGPRSVFGRRDVGDVGGRRGETRRRQAIEESAKKQPTGRRRQRHQHVVEAKAGHGQQQDGPPSKPVRKRPEEG